LGPLFIDPKLSEMTLQETQKSIEKYGSLENFQSSLKTSVSSYELAGSNRSIKDIPDNLQKIAEKIYLSIDGLGTIETQLYDNLRKIKNKDEFNLINIYLYGKYKENMFDLFNSPYELEFEEKQKILSIINIRIPNFLTINKSTGKISSNV